MTAKPATDLSSYFKLKAVLAPRLRFNQTICEDALTEHVHPGIVWLDAGCGRRILLPWRASTERSLANASKAALGCDLDVRGLQAHRTLTRLVASDLEHLPFDKETLDLVTCNMLVEHLDDPAAVFSEFARVLRPRGARHRPHAQCVFVLRDCTPASATRTIQAAARERARWT